MGDSSTNMSKAPTRARAKAKAAAAEDPNIKKWYGEFKNGLYKDKKVTLPDASVHGAIKDLGWVTYNQWYLYEDGTMRVRAGMFEWSELMEQVRETGAKYLELEDGCKASSCWNMYPLQGVSLISIVGSLSTSGVTDMSNMFGMFDGYSGPTYLYLSGLDTSSVRDMRNMFRGCSGLTSLDLSDLDTSSVTDMRYMFEDCSGLTSLDLSGWNTSKVSSEVNSALGMFSSCKTLNEVVVGERLDCLGIQTSGPPMMIPCLPIRGCVTKTASS